MLSLRCPSEEKQFHISLEVHRRWIDATLRIRRTESNGGFPTLGEHGYETLFPFRGSWIVFFHVGSRYLPR